MFKRSRNCLRVIVALCFSFSFKFRTEPWCLQCHKARDRLKMAKDIKITFIDKKEKLAGRKQNMSNSEIFHK